MKGTVISQEKMDQMVKNHQNLYSIPKIQPTIKQFCLNCKSPRLTPFYISNNANLKSKRITSNQIVLNDIDEDTQVIIIDNRSNKTKPISVQILKKNDEDNNKTSRNKRKCPFNEKKDFNKRQKSNISFLDLNK